MVARRLSHRVVAIGFLPPSSASWRPTQIFKNSPGPTRWDCVSIVKHAPRCLLYFGMGHGPGMLLVVGGGGPDAGRGRSGPRKCLTLLSNCLAQPTPESRARSKIALFQVNLAEGIGPGTPGGVSGGCQPWVWGSSGRRKCMRIAYFEHCLGPACPGRVQPWVGVRAGLGTAPKLLIFDHSG